MFAIAPLQADRYSSLVLAPFTRSHKSRYIRPSLSGSGRRTTLTSPDSKASYRENSLTSHSNSVPVGFVDALPYQGVADKSTTRGIRAIWPTRSMTRLHTI